jgi:exosome complex component RRP4
LTDFLRNFLGCQLTVSQLLVAEVQAFFQDGAMSLHTRSLKYGKLRNGLLLELPPRLVRRLKSHFYHLPPPAGPVGVDVILGLNGYVWVSLGTRQDDREGGEGFDAEGVYRNDNDEIDPESRQAIIDVANVIKAFAAHGVPLADTLIAEGYQWLRDQALVPGVPLAAADGERMVRELALSE